MLINPNTRRKIHTASVGSFANQVGTQVNLSSPKEIRATLKRALTTYGEDILRGYRQKGVRPWNLVNVSATNDPQQMWIGIEWETGFCSQREYQAVVQWMWENHHNWALDNEGVGPWLGEFTFPPCNLSTFANGNSMMDKMRAFMAENNIIVPSRRDQIDFTGHSWGPSDYSINVRNGSGMHVNLSHPLMRDNQRNARKINRWFTAAFTYVMDRAASNVKTALFGRDPYGWNYFRHGTNPDTGVQTYWMEFKLFHTPATDEDIAKIRATTLRLAKLFDYVATNIDQLVTPHPNYHDSEHYSNVATPSLANLVAYMNGETDELVCQFPTNL